MAQLLGLQGWRPRHPALGLHETLRPGPGLWVPGAGGRAGLTLQRAGVQSDLEASQLPGTCCLLWAAAAVTAQKGRQERAGGACPAVLRCTCPRALPARAMKCVEAQVGTGRRAPPKAQLRAEMALGIGLGLPVCPSEPVIYALGRGANRRWRGTVPSRQMGPGELPGASSRQPSSARSPAPRRRGPGRTTCLQFPRHSDDTTNHRRCPVGPGPPEVGTFRSPAPPHPQLRKEVVTTVLHTGKKDRGPGGRG